jgi:acyl-CoA thioester hydrolase
MGDPERRVVRSSQSLVSRRVNDAFEKPQDEDDGGDEGRRSYPHFLTIPTRWADNDVYGHVNNVEYYAFFDTVINRWLIAEGGLDIRAREPGDVIGLCVESHCTFKAEFSFPEDVEAGLRVGKLGNSSVRYEIGLFAAGAEEPSASGWFVHVFVDADSRRPTAMSERLRGCLERLRVPSSQVQAAEGAAS